MRRELVATVDVDLPSCCDPTEWARPGDRYFSGRNSSATVSCSGTSGKKLSRWQ